MFLVLKNKCFNKVLICHLKDKSKVLKALLLFFSIVTVLKNFVAL